MWRGLGTEKGKRFCFRIDDLMFSSWVEPLGLKHGFRFFFFLDSGFKVRQKTRNDKRIIGEDEDVS